MSQIIIPAEERSQTRNTDIPLYEALGLTRKQSDKIYFEYKENILPKCKTVADALRAIIDHPTWTIPEKVWCTYNMQNGMNPTAGERLKRMLIEPFTRGTLE